MTTVTDQIAFIVRLPGRPEHREELETRLFEVLDAMAHEPDFVNTYCSRAQDDPDTIILFETWACSAEHFVNVHLKKPYREAYEVELPRLLARERSIEFVTPIRSYPGRTG